MDSGVILGTFSMDFWPPNGNGSENAKTWKIIENHGFSMVFGDPTVIERERKASFLLSFCGAGLGMPFGMLFDDFFTTFGPHFVALRSVAVARIGDPDRGRDQVWCSGQVWCRGQAGSEVPKFRSLEVARPGTETL